MLSGLTHGQPQPRQLSGYEQESIELALAQVGGKRELEPEGKRIEGIDVVTLDVFEERDGVPMLLNWFHVTTQREIIEREILLRPGQPFQQMLADESERNLRAFSQLSVVLIVPLKGSTKDSIRLLVITKDVWSLRLSWAPTTYNGKLTSLTLQPSETNLFGTTQRVAGNLTLGARTYSVGASYFVPRIGGSRIQSYVSANAIFNCQTNEFEGASGWLQYGQPLISSLDKWSWRTAAYLSSQMSAPYVTRGGAICSEKDTSPFPVRSSDTYGSSEASLVGRVRDADGNVLERSSSSHRYFNVWVPQRSRSDRLRGQLVLTRTFFKLNRIHLSFGVEADETRVSEVIDGDEALGTWTTYSRTAEEPGSARWVETVGRFEPGQPPLDEGAVQWARDGYRSALALNTQRDRLNPRDAVLGDRRVGPYVQLHAFRQLYQRMLNHDTLGLQEDVQLGHDVYLRIYPAFQPLSNRNMLGVFSSAAYTLPLSNGFVRAGAAATIELAGPGNTDSRLEISGPQQSDAQIDADLNVVSPDLGVGRFVSMATLTHRPTRYIRRYAYGLGGTDRLRGYKPGEFAGVAHLIINNEFRTRPVRILSVLAGLNLFYDLGDAKNTLQDLELNHGAGVGLRLLFPQLDRDVFRIDVSFPLQGDRSGEYSVTAGFGQVFGAYGKPSNALMPQ